MLAKKEFVKTLKNVKVVLGNGFDLHCGLHTSYSDYYCANYKKYQFIEKLRKDYINKRVISFDFADLKICSINAWDVFFALDNKNKDPKECKKRWSDIERLMLSSFDDLTDDSGDPEAISMRMLTTLKWKTILKCISIDIKTSNDDDNFMIEFVKQKMSFKRIYPDDFYQFLLDELKEFEKSFGLFVYCQIHDRYLEDVNYGSRYFLNINYIEKAKDTLDMLCDNNSLVAIETFNFSYIHTEKMMGILQNINGSYENPIFGIDSKIGPENQLLPGDDSFAFTKTARRMESDMLKNKVSIKQRYENIVIYGHSLDKADFSYFFPTFDRLRLTDSLADGVVVFAFSVYDEEKRQEITKEYRTAVSNLIYEYARSQGITEPGRFLDSLSLQRRIIMYEIPELDSHDYSSSYNDERWKKIYEEIDSISGCTN